MFAFAVWATGEQCLWLCRDRIGVRPLYVGHLQDSLVCDSERKSVRCITSFDRALDHEALAPFMRHDQVPARNSIYASVGKLPTGTPGRSLDAWRQPADELPGSS
jgi:asparagine synthase (glutamine-hydrolysing)